LHYNHPTVNPLPGQADLTSRYAHPT